ncbi:MAG TPA: DUF1330 domain-containing protein [Candidatus Binataceae bacterium]|nr:DUF1330 domain-containing protein [Candidatus Binataceae bacterium]
MSSVVPKAEELQKLIATHKGPVVMLNLLKFRARAEGESGTGEEAYLRYANAAREFLDQVGAKILWAGRSVAMLIGDDSDNWDAVAIVQYPSVKAFLEMVMNPDYQKIHAHREAGLERTGFIACASMDEFANR